MAEKKKPSQGSNKLQIRNSTVDFLVFTRDAHEEGIEVRVQDHDLWLTQNAIGQLFDVDRSVITKHLKNIYESGELSEDATCANLLKLPTTEKPINTSFILCLPLLLWAIVSTPAGQRSSGSGPPRYCIPLPNRAMFWIKADWSTDRFLTRTILTT